MSFPAGVQCSQTDLLARWMPSSSRAGVILSPCPDVAAPVGQLLCSASPGPDDSFSGHFAPLPASTDSSCVGLEPLSLRTQMELNKAGCDQGHQGDEEDSLVESQSHDVSLVMKLEQLRQWQQHMQERLRAQQLQELLRLQQEQHRLLEMMSTQPQDRAEDGEELPPADWAEPCPAQSTVGQEEEEPHTDSPQEGPHTDSPQERPLTEGPQLLLRGPSTGQDGAAEEEEQVQTGLSRISVQEPEPQDSSTREDPSVGDRPINLSCAGQRTFEEMLEEQLRVEEKRLKVVQQPQSDPGGGVPLARPKRVFLKKGEGLLRFTGQKAANKCPRPPAKTIIRSHSEPISLQQGQTGCAQKLPLQRKTATVCKDFPPTSSLYQDTKTVRLRKLQSHLRPHMPHSVPVQRLPEGPASTQPAEPTVVKAPNGGSIPAEVRLQVESTQPGQAHSSPTPELSAQEQAGAQDSMERSFQERLLLWEKTQRKESVELGEFELLEQAAEELSFSSNSSFVLKVLQMDRQKRPQQRRLSSTPIKSPPEPPQEEGHRQPLCEREEEPSDQVPSVYTFPSQSNPPYDKCTYEDADSCPEESSETAESDSDRTVTEQQDGVVFDDHDTWSQLSEEHSFSTASPDRPASPVERPVNRKVAVLKAVDMKKPPDGPAPSQLMSRLFPALKTQSHNAPVSPPPTAAVPQSVPNSTHAPQAQSELLRERLVELEVQIERFKKENAALAKLRKDNQKVQEELRKERSEFEQLKAQEMNRFEEYKREENRKLQRERKLLDKHMTAARAVPNKSERQEIQALKQQLSSVQEELRRKESRWANNHSRQRHQLEALGQDNGALRDEVKTLEKLRLSAWRKSSTDTDKSSAPKGVKFATPLDSSSGRQNSLPAPARRWSRRASAPGATTEPTGMRSSLRTATLMGTSVEESEPEHEDQNQYSPIPEETQRCSPSDPQPVPQPALQPTPPPAPQDPNPAPECESRLQAPQEEAPSTEGKVEQLLSNGSRLMLFPNGTKKEVSPDGKTVKVTFFNGDTKEVTADQRVIYFYAEAQTTHITYPDGMEVLHFPNNQTEKHFPDGHKEITFSDHTVKTLYPDGREESVLTDGTIIQVHPDGSKEIHFNTGQREVHTADYKRREYPDGTVKTVYSDGRQETRYPTGRLRIKDGEGNVVLDNRA